MKNSSFRTAAQASFLRIGKAYKQSRPLRRFFRTAASILVASTMHYERNIFNQNVTFEYAKTHWRELPPEKSIWHRMGPGNENNRKFVGPIGGHCEAVFSPDGKPVTDPHNEASWNFAGDNFCGGVFHGIFDVLPYMIEGNTPSDMLNTYRFKALIDYFHDKGLSQDSEKH